MSVGNYVGEIRYRGLRLKEISWCYAYDPDGVDGRGELLVLGGYVERGNKGYWYYARKDGSEEVEQIQMEGVEIRKVGSSEYKKLDSVKEKYEETNGIQWGGSVAEVCSDIIMGLKGTGIIMYDEWFEDAKEFIPGVYTDVFVDIVAYEDKESFLQSRYYPLYSYANKDMRKLGSGVLELLDMLRGSLEEWVVDREVLDKVGGELDYKCVNGIYWLHRVSDF